MEWSSVLPIQTGVFGSVEFAKIVQKSFGYEARLYVLEDHASRIACPFFLRPIRSWSLHEKVAPRLWDAVSPDFAGPLAHGEPTPSLAMEFPKRLSRWACSQSIVTEFIHLHPWHAFTGALLDHCLQFDREIVYVDLSWPEERLWQASLTHACRKNVNRSQRENVRVFEAQTIDDIREFHRIYIQTMEDRNALQHYYLSLDYFTMIFEQLRGSARFVLAEYRNQVVAGTLYLYDRDDVYSYLGGADVSFQQVRPTNAIVYDTILWAKRQGRKRLILGGGYSPNDGIFRFKSSFSPARAKFFVYRRIHLPETYATLCRSWSSIFGKDAQSTAYFPPYRFLPGSESAQDSGSSAPALAE
jgi:hypothetical protein